MAIKLDYVTKETVTNLKRNISMASAALLTVAVSLTLVGGALLVKRGVERATIQWRGNVELSIFMKADASQQELEAVDRQLTAMPEVSRFRYVDKAAAYEEFRQIFANGQKLPRLALLPAHADLAIDLLTPRAASAGLASFRYVAYGDSRPIMIGSCQNLAEQSQNDAQNPASGRFVGLCGDKCAAGSFPSLTRGRP